MTLTVAHKVRLRAAVESAIRRYFAETRALEVSTPSLVANPGLEPQLRAFDATPRHCPALGRRALHTSPEYAIKATFAEVETDVFTLARCFRDEPLSRWHHPEFTMLEWYRRTDGMEPVMRDVEHLLTAASRAAAEVLERPTPALGRSFRRLTVQQAFRDAADIDVLEASRDQMASAASARGLATQPEWDWNTLFSLLYAFVVEPSLAGDTPVFLTHFPASEAALARLDDDDPRVALRFEVYGTAPRATGEQDVIELANAFVELTDPVEQRDRFASDLARRSADDAPTYPMPEPMLAGIAAMPPTTGIALGLERLLVWAAQCCGYETRVSDYLLGEPRPVDPVS